MKKHTPLPAVLAVYAFLGAVVAALLLAPALLVIAVALVMAVAGFSWVYWTGELHSRRIAKKESEAERDRVALKEANRRDVMVRGRRRVGMHR